MKKSGEQKLLNEVLNKAIALVFCNVEEIEAIEASKQENDDFKAKLDVKTCIQDTLTGLACEQCDYSMDTNYRLKVHIRFFIERKIYTSSILL